MPKDCGFGIYYFLKLFGVNHKTSLDKIKLMLKKAVEQ
jgi:hypothetical protein